MAINRQHIIACYRQHQGPRHRLMTANATADLQLPPGAQCTINTNITISRCGGADIDFIQLNTSRRHLQRSIFQCQLAGNKRVTDNTAQLHTTIDNTADTVNRQKKLQPFQRLQMHVHVTLQGIIIDQLNTGIDVEGFTLVKYQLAVCRQLPVVQLQGHERLLPVDRAGRLFINHPVQSA